MQATGCCVDNAINLLLRQLNIDTFFLGQHSKTAPTSPVPSPLSLRDVSPPRQCHQLKVEMDKKVKKL